MKKGRVNAKYEEKYIKANRTFPVGKTILMAIVLAVQIGIIVLACNFQPKPQDIIREYGITVEPRQDGSLDIGYSFVWEAVDASEELTWIEIGMANKDYTLYSESLSSTISQATKENDDGEVYLRLDLDRAYAAGEVLEFSFKINQKNMLCQDGNGYFYEFVPCWFNSTPVEQYTFRWADNGQVTSVNGGHRQGGYFTWSGSMECGEYVLMGVHYTQSSFAGCTTTSYRAFNDGGVYNSLEEDKAAMVALAVIVAIVLIAVHVWIVDSVVSYHRGRGFLTGHGYHIHTYGRYNPYYIRARDKYNAQHGGRSGGGGGGGGGCACACACACAGGGRAGCSQKDTYGTPLENQES